MQSRRGLGFTPAFWLQEAGRPTREPRRGFSRKAADISGVFKAATRRVPGFNASRGWL
jgi:hypothetical protein